MKVIKGEQEFIHKAAKVVNAPQYELNVSDCSRSIYKEAKILKCGVTKDQVFWVNFTYTEATWADTGDNAYLFCLANCAHNQQCAEFKRQFDACDGMVLADVEVNWRIKGVKNPTTGIYANETIVTLLKIS